MKYFPIHILIKDMSFCICYFLIEKFIKHKDYFFKTEWWPVKEIIGAGIYLGSVVMIINLIVFALIYFVFRGEKERPKSFKFGKARHVLSLILIFFSINLEGTYINYFVAALVSLLVSSYTYKKLNADLSYEEMVKNCLGLK